MMNDRCIIIGAGEIRDDNYIKSFICESDYIICADGGVDFCERNAINVNLAVGDFDSAKSVIRSDCETITFPVIKDKSDLLLAFEESIKRGYKEFILLGCTGGRFDHTYANLLLLKTAFNYSVKMQIVDEHNIIYLSNEKNFTIPYQKNKKVSFFAFGEDVKGLCLTNSKYELNNYDLSIEDSICLGNDFSENCGINVKFSSGILMVILSTDL